MSMFKKKRSPLEQPRPAAEPKESSQARQLWSGEITYTDLKNVQVREIARIVLAGGEVTFERCERDAMGEAKWISYPESVEKPDMTISWGYRYHVYLLNPAIRACISAAARDES